MDRKKLVDKVLKKLASPTTVNQFLKDPKVNTRINFLIDKFNKNLGQMEPASAADTMKYYFDKLVDDYNISDKSDITKVIEHILDRSYRRQSKNIIPALNELAKLYKIDIKLVAH